MSNADQSGNPGKPDDGKRTREGHENVGGIPGKESHGGDVAPPNSDEAGRRQSPESGPPDQH